MGPWPWVWVRGTEVAVKLAKCLLQEFANPSQSLDTDTILLVLLTHRITQDQAKVINELSRINQNSVICGFIFQK